MKLEIIIYDIDVEGMTIEEINSFKDKNFYLPVDLYIHTTIDDTIHTFNCCIANEGGLIEKLIKYDRFYEKEGVLYFNHYNLLLIEDFSYEKLEKIIHHICDSIDTTDKNWKQIARELSQYFGYEYHYLLGTPRFIVDHLKF
ncbi:MAG: hypothetical protein ACI97N_000150 [Cognaticolwellia sp.]|jgi:hypothetical protein